MTSRHDDLLPLVALLFAFVLFAAVAFAAAYSSEKGRTRRIEQKVDDLVRNEKRDRYLLCVVADASGADALPQPCLDSKGRSIVSTTTPP